MLTGTVWTNDTALARQIALNREAEAHDGVRQDFQVDWSAVAEANPAYGGHIGGKDDLLNAAALLVQAQPLSQLRTASGRRRQLTTPE